MVTVPMVATVFLSHQISELEKIYKVTLFTNLNHQNELLNWVSKKVDVIDIPIARKINLLSDIKVLFLLLKYFNKFNFSIVHSVTPKSGLLSILASYLTRVPVRIHTFTGQVWATKNGLSKKILKWLDYLISSLATTVIIDSHSQRNFLIKNKIIKENNSIVLGNGSISGVNHERFRIDLLLRKKIRSDLKISDDTVIFLYLGRIKKEKGVLDLLEAFSLIKEKYKNTRLLIVGPDEDFLASIIKKQDKVSLFPYTQNPEEFMNASDVFCLPSYREGFGSVIIEAGACGIPSIGTKIYGLTDAIKDNLTGILISLKSINELEKAMEVMILDSKVRSDMGKAAYEYSIRRFSQENITKKLISLYSNLLQSKPKK